MTDCVTENRRKWLRTRTLYGGTITTVGGTPIIACTIRSISPFGAQVRLLSEHILPEQFILVDEKNAVAHRATVVWRGDRPLLGIPDIPIRHRDRPILTHRRHY